MRTAFQSSPVTSPLPTILTSPLPTIQVRTAFQSSQGALMRTILFSSQRATGNTKEVRRPGTARVQGG